MRTRTTTTRFATLALVVTATLTTAVAAGLATDQWRVVHVVSGSMRPAIQQDDLVVATPKPARSVETGQVLVFHAPDDGRLTVHRVVEVLERGDRPVVRTRGDAARTPDPWTLRLEDDIVWTVRRTVPAVGAALVWSRSPAARMGVLVTGAILFVLLGLRAIWAARPAVADAA